MVQKRDLLTRGTERPFRCLDLDCYLLAVAILIGCAFAVPDKGVPVDYALQRFSTIFMDFYDDLDTVHHDDDITIT